MLAELDVAVATARRIDAGQAGVLRVNFVGSALLSIVPGIVQRFRRARPGVEVELRERSTVEQLRALSAGVVDVGLVRPPIEPDDALRDRGRDARAHRRGDARPATRSPRCGGSRCARLAAEPLVLFPRDQAPGFHDLLTGRLAATGTSPHVVQYAPEMLTIIGLVAAGIGVSPVPASVAQLALDGVTYRPLGGAPDTELVAVTRAGDDSPLVAAFVADARATAHESRRPVAQAPTRSAAPAPPSRASICSSLASRFSRHPDRGGVDQPAVERDRALALRRRPPASRR